MRFCFKCLRCGLRWEQTDRFADFCWQCGSFEVHRDYKAEGVGIGPGVRVSRDGTMLDQARLFLPDNDDFKGPGDPDGTKGARKWLDEHQPKESVGYNPLLDIERKSF